MTLYELTEQASQLYEMLESGEIDEQILNDTLESMGGVEKVESCCKIKRQFETDIAGIDEEIKRLQNKKKQYKNAVERLKNSILAYMQATSQKQVKTPLFTISRRNNQSLTVIDETKIPYDFLIAQPPKIDTKGLKEFLKDNQCEGAYIEEKESVTIR